MAVTKRKDILDQLLYRLAAIRVTNGYNSDILTVDRQRDMIGDPYSPEECWAVNVRDGKAEITHNCSDDEHRFPVSIELHASSRITLAAAESALADVIDCIDQHNTLAGYADGIDVESHEIDLGLTGDVITAVMIEILIHYTTDKGRI